MRMRWSVAAVVPALVAALGVLAPAGAATAAEQAVDLSGRHTVKCEFIPTPNDPAAKPVRPPRPVASNRGTVHATLWTNHGIIRMELDRKNAPCAVHNLVSLTQQRFFNRTQCWRLTNSARLGVLQCGDIWAAEKGGPGYKFADEVTGKETYPRGTVAMGNFGPDTNGSQFFIVHSFANIKPAYTVLGKVTWGMHVLDKIVAGGIIPGEGGPLDGLPKLPVKIHLATISPW